jgi:hypothetical protein
MHQWLQQQINLQYIHHGMITLDSSRFWMEKYISCCRVGIGKRDYPQASILITTNTYNHYIEWLVIVYGYVQVKKLLGY